MADVGTTPVRPNSFEMEADVNVEFNEASSRQQINSGESVKTLFGKIRKFLTDLKAVAFSGSYSDLSGVPDLSVYATKAGLDTKAEKALYGDNGLNLGRLAGSTVGFLSLTMGRANAATGGYSFSQGFDNTASGVASFAGGQSSAADGENALAHGYFVKTTKDNEKAFGVYNKSSTDTIFSVGDGTSETARHNAFEITKTGGKLHDKDIATTDLIPTELPANGGNADYATNAGNAEKLGGKDASAYSTSIIKSVTFSAATADGYVWTGIPFPKYVIGVDLEHLDVIAQFYKGSNEAAARAEWAMMFFSRRDVTTPLNGSFNGRIYYVD